MKLRQYLLAVGAVILAGIGTASCSSNYDEDASQTTDDELSAVPQNPHRALCGDGSPGTMRCFARARTDAQGKITAFATPSGFGPADLASAYNLPSTGGAGVTIAIVDAMDNPNAEADLAKYRTQYGLPPCTTANGCFKKVNQSGQASPLPALDTGWAGEISLDLDVASAICPSCKILLVEATSATMANLGAAVNTAVALGATVVSNSWGGSESSSDPQSDTSYFNHPGVTIFASSGDSGYGVSYPASSKYIVAVGGTKLVKSTSNTRGWTEGVWTGAGSGCSKYVGKPGFQTDTGCTKRTVADVSAVADPNTGVAVYDSYNGGWTVYGGTSVAAPVVAAIYALVGKGGAGNAYAYANTNAFYDVTSGSNGSCGSSYLCTGKAGYDGPTGLGTPNGQVLAGGTVPDAGTDSGKDSGIDSGTDAGKDSGTDSGKDLGTDSGSDAGTCSHSTCSTGSKLVSGCDPCTTKICAKDSFCCSTAWDSQCVGEVKSVCGQTCGGSADAGTDSGTDSGTSTCSHPICAAGAKLTKTCDPCATQVCAADSFCCNTEWDSICVGEVSSICGQSCP